MKIRHKPMPVDLAILSAEQYVDAAVQFTGKTAKVKKSPPSSHPEDGPRKRAKTSSVTVVTDVVDDDGEEEKMKRARGRPRLDTKDQSAAERRRTQIRLAQRAYRSRKDNAIQSLEKRVQDLQEANEEMSNTFMKLHDSAVNHGLLQQAPDFARELRAATEKFLSLARRSSEDTENDGQIESPGQESRSGRRSGRRNRNETSGSPEAIEPHPPSNEANPIWGGYIVTNEPERAPTVTMAHLTNPPVQAMNMATLENASLPFQINSDSPFPDFFGKIPNMSSSYPPLSPFSSLPLPRTFSSTENTFGRRLQRCAIERGYQLITMANPPEERFANVFGFCLLFETAEKIRERLRRALDKTKAESLHDWQAPFWALGGSGQHQMPARSGRDGGGSGRVGNQGTADMLKHGFPGAELGMGPFDARTAEARDKKLDPCMRIVLPGFEGAFFDADEVEMYLHSRGVSIQPGQDYLTTEVDVASFDDGIAAAGQVQGQQSLQTAFNDWPQSLDEAFGVASVSTLTPPRLSPGSRSVSDSTSLTMPDMQTDSSAWPMSDESSRFFARTTSSPGSFGDGGNMFAFAGIGDNLNSTSESRKRLVTLDVSVLIKELISRGVCLGRSPGFRPKDINTAFWIATRSDGILDL